MKRLSVRLMLMSLTPALSKPSTLHKMAPPIKAPLPAALTAEGFTEHKKNSLLKRKAAVLRTEPASSDSELSPLSDEEPVIAKKPARKKRKVATKSKVVVNEGTFVAANAAKPVEMTRSKRKAKAAVVEAEILEDTQENQTSMKRKRKPAVTEPAVYDIPDVERKETTFKGKLHPQASICILINGSFTSLQVD